MRLERTFSHLLKSSYTDDPIVWQAASPVSYIDARDPPVLVIHGTDDGTLPVEQARSFYDELDAAGVESRLLLIEGGGHEITNSFAFHRVMSEIEAFLRPLLTPKATSR